MANALSILLLDPDGLLRAHDLSDRWRVHAFQDVDGASAGLAHLDPEVLLTTLSNDGLAFCRQAASRDPSLPVIMVARDPSTSDVMRAMRVGVRDIIPLEDPRARDPLPERLNRALDLAVSWRKALSRGVAMEVEQLRKDARVRQRRMDGLQDRVAELTQQLDAESGLLAQTQHELEVQRELALAAVRAKSRFLANMSHELHTPLNAIIGYAEMLHEALEAPERRKDAQTIVDSSRDLLALLQEVLHLSRLEAGQVHPVFEPVAVPELLADATGRVAEAAELAKTSVVVGDLAVDEVVTDPQRLSEVLGHLIDNAVKFSPGGSVELTVRRELSDDGSAARGWVVFSVRDTGIGIAPEQLSRMFDAFTQGDASDTRRFGGTGLGLAVARQIARVLGGRLEAESTVGEGSLFELKLPDAAQTAVSAHTNAEHTVLVIDDDPVLRSLVHRMLVADGHAVVASGSGLDALELARTHQPDLILLDTQLPGMTGFAVLSALADDPAVDTIPVVMLASDADAEKALAEGARDTLSKPVSRTALRRTIAQHARSEDPAGLVVLGADLPECVAPLVSEGLDVRAVPAHLLTEALENRPGAVLLPDGLAIPALRLALDVLAEHAGGVPVLALVGRIPEAEVRFLEEQFAGVVFDHGDPTARLRRYASAR